MWSQKLEPVLNGIPSASYGRVYVVTNNGLLAIKGTSGSIIWRIASIPTGDYSYRVTPTFGNITGQLVASRCLGPTAPALCMYSAFATPIENAGMTPWSSKITLLVLAYASLAVAFF